MFNLESIQIVRAMTTNTLHSARARLALMSDLEPGRDLAIEAIDSELLARDVSQYPRERYLGAAPDVKAKNK